MNTHTIQTLRQDTPGCQQVLHFNNAGAALMPLPVINAVKEHLDLEAMHGGYKAAELAKNQIQKIYNKAAQLLNCQEDENVKLIAITHVPTQGGLINPVIEIGKIANKLQIPYLLDATQSIGQMPVDVKTIGCDFLCATGRKFLRGPRGTGFLYASRFETWEQNIAAKIGLGVALEYALNLGMETIWERIQYLANHLRNKLREIPSITLHDLGQNQCGIITFTCKNKSAIDIKNELAKKKMNVSISLNEYSRLDMTQRNLSALVRASVHYYNTEAEIDLFYKAILSSTTNA